MTPNHEGPCPYCRKPMGEPHDEWCGYIRAVFESPDPVVTTYNTLDAEVARLKTENERLHMDVEVVTASLDAAMDERDRLRKFCEALIPGGQEAWDVGIASGIVVVVPETGKYEWAWSPLAQEAKPS